MKPMDEAWKVLKAIPSQEVVQNRYRFTGQGHPFLDANFEPTQDVKRDLVEQMRLQTRHPALNPAHVIESVNDRPTNLSEVSPLSPLLPSDILRYPQGFNITGVETGRADEERVRQQRMNERSQQSLTGNTFPPRLIDRHPYTNETRYAMQMAARGNELSDEEMENLRQQAQQMPFSYEGQ